MKSSLSQGLYKSVIGRRFRTDERSRRGHRIRVEERVPCDEGQKSTAHLQIANQLSVEQVVPSVLPPTVIPAASRSDNRDSGQETQRGMTGRACSPPIGPNDNTPAYPPWTNRHVADRNHAYTSNATSMFKSESSFKVLWSRKNPEFPSGNHPTKYSNRPPVSFTRRRNSAFSTN